MNIEQNFITISKLFALIEKKEVVVIDVRSLTEFEEGHICGALHRPVDTIPSSVIDIPKETTIVTACNKGHGRSEDATNLLRNAGWKNTFWLEGGYLGWTETGLNEFVSKINSTKERIVGVGMPIAGHPLHRSVQALLMHTAPTSGQTHKRFGGKG